MDIELISTYCSDGIEIANNASRLLDNGAPDSQFRGFAQQLEVLKERFAKQELTILVTGEVSTGKSTLLNTLIGTDALSVAQETCTNVPTKISYGEDERYIVHFSDDAKGNTRPLLEIRKDEVSKYTSESGNPKNSMGVAFIEVTLNNPILSHGLSFIDTPGLGAIDPLHAITTYNIASTADIIFFLGDSSKPLTSVEVISLKNLIKVSNASYVAHLVTKSDENDPQTILNENKQILHHEFESVKIDYFIVSSNKYREYLISDDKYDLEDSGFREVYSYIDKINCDLSYLLGQRFKGLALHICEKIHSELNSLCESVENPVAQETRRDELKAIKERLEEIEREWPNWNAKLNQKQKLFESEIQQFLTLSKISMVNHVEEMLKGTSYLKDKESLASSITADMVKFQNDLETKFTSGYINIYNWLRNETGLSEIQDKIGGPEFNSTNLHIDEGVGQIAIGHKIRNIGISVGMGTMLTGAGFKVGAIAGAKIGAMIGTSIAPGIGSLIGAAVGSLAGIASGIAVYLGLNKDQKERQRREIQNSCVNQINQYFANISGKITSADIPNSTDLALEFQNQLRNEKKSCQARFNRLADLALRLRTNYDGVNSLNKQSKELVYSLSKS